MISFLPRDPDSIELPVILDRPVEEEDHLLLVRILEIIPARQLTFEDSLQEVRADFAEIKKPEIIHQMCDEILQEANFRLVVPVQDRM